MADSSGGGTGQKFRIKGRPRALSYPATRRPQTPTAKRRADQKATQAKSVSTARRQAAPRNDTRLAAQDKVSNRMSREGKTFNARDTRTRRALGQQVPATPVRRRPAESRARAVSTPGKTAPIRLQRKPRDNSGIGRAVRALATGGMVASTLTRSLPGRLGGAPIPVPLPARVALTTAGYLTGQVGLSGNASRRIRRMKAKPRRLSKT